MNNRVELIALEGFPLVEPGEAIVPLLLRNLRDNQLELQRGDILILAQKIVSKSENRYLDLTKVLPSEEAIAVARRCEKDPRLVEAILRESSEIIRCKPGVIVTRHKLGFILANAGIDHSNIPNSADGNRVLLLPEDPDSSARHIREAINTHVGIEIGVLINDSFGRPWRLGTTGVCIGCAGISPLEDRRGSLDLFGQEMRATQIGTGDEIAAAASLLQGQADEGRPVVIIRGLAYSKGSDGAASLLRPPAEDMFL